MIVVKRKIGSIALDVTVSEKHTDTLEITQFPVLSGSVITDHAYKLPMQLTIKAGQGTGPGQYAYGVNPETIITADIPNDNGQYTFEEDDSYTITGGDINRPTRTYMQLLGLQASRQPFTVITGKRMYKNMLIKNISVTTDQDTENVLMFTADLQEIIIVATANYGETSVLIQAQDGPNGTGNKATEEVGQSTAKATYGKKDKNNILEEVNTYKKSVENGDPNFNTVTATKGSASKVPLPNDNQINQMNNPSNDTWKEIESSLNQLGDTAIQGGSKK